MRVELFAFLAAHLIEHPTRIDRATIEQDRLELLVSGNPWWRPGASYEDEGRITLGFEGLTEGALTVWFDNDSSEALEDFEVRRLGGVDWAQPASHAIDCYERLPDPAALYAKLQDYLTDAGAFLNAADFLNGGGTLSRFAALTSTGPDVLIGGYYLLARAPEVVCRLLCDELDWQRVGYRLEVKPQPLDDRLWVTLGESDFLCESAWVEVADEGRDGAPPRPE